MLLMYLLVSEIISIALQHKELKVQDGPGHPGPVGTWGPAGRVDTWHSRWPWKTATVARAQRTMKKKSKRPALTEQKSILMGMSLKETNPLVGVLEIKVDSMLGFTVDPQYGVQALLWSERASCIPTMISILFAPQKSCPPFLVGL